MEMLSVIQSNVHIWLCNAERSHHSSVISLHAHLDYVTLKECQACKDLLYENHPSAADKGSRGVQDVWLALDPLVNMNRVHSCIMDSEDADERPLAHGTPEQSQFCFNYVL